LEVGEKEAKSTFLTYLLSRTEMSPEEVNANCVDLFIGATETVMLHWSLFSQRLPLNEIRKNTVYPLTPTAAIWVQL